MTANILMAASAAIIGLLGLAQLVLTFSGPKLLPRDPSFQAALDRVAPVITTHTTIWRMWMGFNASHSMGALLFGLDYAYLALVHGDRLFQYVSPPRGLRHAAGFVVLARRYWFITPFAGASVSPALYLLSIGVAWTT